MLEKRLAVVVAGVLGGVVALGLTHLTGSDLGTATVVGLLVGLVIGILAELRVREVSGEG